MHKIKRRTILILFLAVHSYIFAQQDTISLSLQEAMDYATIHGYQSINAQQDIEIAEKKIKETIALGLPQLNASGAFTKNLIIQETAFEMDGERVIFKMGSNYSSSIGAQWDQLLFDGSYLVGLKASKVYAQLTKDAKEKTNIELKKTTSEVYFLALIAKANIEDFRKILDANKKSYIQTQAFLENGFIDQIDLDQVQLMVTESKRLYLEAQRQYDVAMAVLKFTIGLNIDIPLLVTDSVSSLIATIPPFSKDTLNVEDHIDYKTISTQIEVKDLDIKNQKAYAIPKLYGFLNYNYIYFGDDLTDLYNSEGAAIGLSLSIPIISSGKRSAQLKQKKIELEKLNVQQTMIEESLKHDFLIATTNLQNARLQYENASENRDVSIRMYKNSHLKYKNGMLSSLDLMQYENKMIESIISFHKASLNYFNMYMNYKKVLSQL